MDEELLQLLYKNKGYSKWWTYEEFKNELYNDAKYRKKVYDETGTSKVATYEQFNKRLAVSPANAKKAAADLAEARRAKSLNQAAEQDGGGLWNTTRDFLNTVTDHAVEAAAGLVRPVEHAATSLYGYLTDTDVSETHKAIDKRVDATIDAYQFMLGDPMGAVSAMGDKDDGVSAVSDYKKKRDAANKSWEVELFDDDKGFWDNVKGIPGKLASQPGKTLMNVGTSLADIYINPKSVGKRFFGMAVDGAYAELKKIGEENPDLKIEEHPDLALGYAVGIGAVQGLAEKYSLELITGPAMSKRLSKYVLNKAIREVTRNGGVITTDLLDREMAKVAGKLSTKAGKAGISALIGTVVEGSEEGITEVASDGLRLAFNAVGKANGIDNNIFDTEEMMRTAGQRYVTNSVMGGLSGAPLGGFHGFFENTHDYIQHRYATDDNKENARNNINEEIANNKNYSPEIKEALQGYNDIMYDSSTKIPKDADTETKKKLMTLIAQKQHRISEIQAADQERGKLDPALADIEQQKQEIRKAALAHNNAEIAATYKGESIKYEDDGNGGYTRTIGDKKDHISETEYIIGRNMSEPGWSEDTDIFNEEDDDGDIADGNSTEDDTDTDTDTDNFIGDLSAGISALSGREVQTAGPVKVGSTIEHDGVKGVVSEVNMHKDGGIRSIAYEDENGDKKFVFLNGKSLKDSGVTVREQNQNIPSELQKQIDAIEAKRKAVLQRHEEVLVPDKPQHVHENERKAINKEYDNQINELKNRWNETRSNASDGSIGTTNQQSSENNARTMADGDEDGGGDLQGLQNGQDQTGTNNAQSEGGIQGRTNDGTAQGVQSGDGNTSTDFKILEALERLDNKRDAKVLAAQEMASIDPGYDLEGQLKKINQEHAEETKYAPNEVMKGELAQRLYAEKEKLRKDRDRKVKRVGDLAKQLGDGVPVDSIDRINKEYEKAKSKLEQEHNDKVAEIDRERNESKRFGKDKIPSDNIASDTIIEHKKNKYRVVTTQRSGRTIIFAEDGKEIPERIIKRTRKGAKAAKNPLFTSIEREALGLVTDAMIEAHRKQLLKEALDSDMGPNNAYEYALYYFANGGKVSAASIKKEIGVGRMIWAVGAKGDEHAPDIEVLADRLYDKMMNAQNLEFTPDDGTQFRDAIIDVLSSYSGVRAIQDTIIQLHQSYIGTEEAATDEFIQSEYDTLSDYEKDVIEWERGMDSMNDSEMANHYMGRLELMPEAEQKAYWEAEAKAYNEQIELNKITDGEQGEYGEQRADSVGENDTGAEAHSDGKLQEGEVPILGETEGKRRNTGQSEKDARGERAEGEGEPTGERGREGIEDIKPIGRGFFGNIYDQFKGKAKEAVAFLMRKKEGEAIGALHHDEIGDIDLVWGDEKAGLQKISQKHPEILNNLQERLSQAKIVSKTDNKIKLESETDFFVVSPHYFGEEKRWLITAYEKRENTASANRMNNETESVKTDNRIDTATPKDSVSNTKQQSEAESSDVEAKKADIERRREEELKNNTYKGALKTLPKSEEENPEIISDKDEVKRAEARIERMIATSKSLDEFSSRFNYVVDFNVRQLLNKFVEDRIAGKTNQSFSEWRNGSSKEEINAKYDAELEDLEKKKSESEGEYTESKEKDNAGHNFIEKNGNQFLGEIGEDVSREIKRQSAPIKLSIGNEEYGVSHIKKRHGDEIKDSGYESVEDFVSDVAQNYNEIRKGEQGALFIIKRNGLDKVGVIKLTQSESGEYYNVETAFVSRKEYINKKELLYSGKSSPTKDVATKSEFQKNQQQSNTDQPSSTDSNSFGNKQQSETESSDVEAKKTERQKKIDAINKEIDDIWNDFNKLGIALTPEQQAQNMAKAIRLVSLYTQKGVYKLADIIEDAINKIGRANVEDLLPFLKKAYMAAQNEVDDDVLDHMDGVKEVRAMEMPEDVSKSEEMTAANQILEAMQNNAVPERKLELSPKNWLAEFGEDGIIATPIGEVKMGENQYEKLVSNGRVGQFGMIKPTLETPDVIIEKKNEGNGEPIDRASTYLFVKTYISDGEKRKNFVSVTISKEGREVVISNHIKRDGQIRSDMFNEKVLWNRFEIDSNSLGKNQDLSSDSTNKDLNTNLPGSNSQSNLESKRSDDVESSEKKDNFTKNNKNEQPKSNKKRSGQGGTFVDRTHQEYEQGSLFGTEEGSDTVSGSTEERSGISQGSGGNEGSVSSGRSRGNSESNNSVSRTLSGLTTVPQPGTIEPAPSPKLNYTPSTEDDGKGKTFNVKQHFTDNNNAIRTLLSILKDGDRLATDAEKLALGKYVGWGGIKVANRLDGQQWSEADLPYKEMYDELVSLAKEFEALGYKGLLKDIGRSTLNAHYTGADIIGGVYEALGQMGFTGGHVLEPSAGIGHFIGLMPQSMAKNSAVSAVELDRFTGKILEKLYPAASTFIKGYQEAGFAPASFDLIVSNIPFGDYQVLTQRSDSEVVRRAGKKIHNYFFAKALEQTKEGGVIAFVTSTGVMDAPANEFLREHLSQNAELLGAIRLPNNAFKKNAGTQVTTDIIFLRKNTGNNLNQNFVKTSTITVDGHEMNVNNYFIDNPGHVIGEYVVGRLYGGKNLAVEYKGDKTLSEEISDVVKNNFPKNILQPVVARPTQVQSVQGRTTEPFNIHINADGNAGYYDGHHNWVEIAKKHQPKVGDFLSLKEVLQKQYELENNPAVSDEEVEVNRKLLDRAYNNFVSKWGNINHKENKPFILSDIFGYNIASLENVSENGRKYTKADIFSKRAIVQTRRAESANSIMDAITAVINERGGVDVSRVAELLNEDPSTIVDNYYGVLFYDSDGSVVSREEYLSGNVKKKYREAVELSKGNPIYEKNMEALEAVIPEDIPIEEIDINIGARWVPIGYYNQFADHIFGTETRISYNRILDQYKAAGYKTANATTIYGTSRVDGYTLLEHAMHGSRPTVYDKTADDKSVVNAEETQLAGEKLDEIANQFKDWIIADAERAKVLGGLYNDAFNTTIKREFQPGGLSIRGASSAIKLADHQEIGVKMLTTNNGGIIDHIVGAGKSFLSISAAMKMKELGIANKPTIIGLKSTIQDLVSDAQKLFPTARILSPSESDFELKNRKAFLSKIQNNDWDLIIMSHEQFGFIPQDIDFQKSIIQAEIAEIEQALLEQSLETGNSPSKRQMGGLEKRKENLSVKLQELAKRDTDKEVLNFRNIGIDHLIVDESQYFKNLAYTTKINKVAGLGNPTGSKRSYNMLTAIRSLQALHGGDKGVTFMSGTPISNSLVEMYLLLKYLRPTKMEELGYRTFDAWIKQFAIQSNELEFTVAGSVKTKTRFREFINVPELSMLYNEIADVRNDSNLKLPKPTIRGGKPTPVVVRQSEEQREWTDRLIEFANQKHGQRDGALIGKPNMSESQQNAAMLLVTNISNKMAVDLRLVDKNAAFNPEGKLPTAAKTVKQEYDASSAIRGTQLIFSDIGTPKTGRVADDLLSYLEDEMNVNPDMINLIFGEANDTGKRPARSINQIKANIKSVLEYTDTQLEQIMTDSKGMTADFNAYSELKRLLVEQGIPAEEIAFIHDYKTKKQRQDLFKKVNNGDVRVVIGSTQKLGTGVNVQQRIVALHHIDAKWNPADMEQRNGRGIRQKNMNSEVAIYNYGTEQTLDAYKYQLIATKQKFIDQVKSGALGGNRFVREDEGEDMSAQEIVALLSGNPLLLEKAKLDADIEKLIRSKRGFIAAQNRIESSKVELERSIPRQEEFIKKREADLATTKANIRENADGKMEPTVVIDGKRVDDAKTRRSLLDAKLEQLKKSPVGTKMTLAKVAGLDYVGERLEQTEGLFSSDIGYELVGEMTYKTSSVPSNTILDRMPQDLPKAVNVLNRDKEKLETLRGQDKGGEWGKQEELDSKVARRKEVEAELAPKENGSIVVDRGPQLQANTTQDKGLSKPMFTKLVDTIKQWLGANFDIDHVGETLRKMLGRDPKSVLFNQQWKEINDRFNSELDELTPENADSKVLWLGSPTAILKAAGLPNKPFKFYGNKLLKKAKLHGYSPKALKNLPYALQNPIAVFDYEKDGVFNILTEIEIDGKKVLVGVQINNESELDVNLIKTAFGKNTDSIVGWINQGRGIYFDKEKALTYLQSTAPIAATSNSSELNSATKIIQNHENPKINEADLQAENDYDTYGFSLPVEFTKPSELTAEELPNYVGKDVAKRMIEDTSSPTENNPKRFQGNDLKVGGSGMKGFYGSPTENNKGVVGKTAEKLVKELTGEDVRVETTTINGVEQHSIAITPAMREATGVGMPLFSISDMEKSLLGKSDFNPDGTIKEEVRREIREEKARIESEAKANGTYMKAPNGKPSNLNEAQWATVRTKRFKENFFGDWESANIITLAENAWNDKDFKDKVSFGISKNLSNRLSELLGHDIEQVVLTADAIRHIKNHHGQNETQRGQVDLTPNDIAILPYVLNNFDTAKLAPEFDDKKGNRAIEITKRINGISVVATIERGKDRQFVVTSWQTKKSDALVANKTTGLYVQNDSDIAKIQNEIEKIKSAKENASKVVDENGEPLVVYHGTASSFTVFDKAKVGSNFKSQNLGKLGFYFANHPKADIAKNWYFGTNASEFANNAASEFTDDGTGIGANVMPVFLNIKNPITINADGYYSALSAIDKNESGIIIGNALNGKDGIVSRYETEESTDIAYVATDPTQIKSAIGNIGTFSSDSNDIRYSASGEINPAYHAAVQAEELGNNNPNIPIIIDLSETNNDKGEILKKFAGTWLDLIQDKHSPFYQRGLDLIKDTEYYEKAGKDARKALEMAIADNTNTIKKSSGLITWLRNFWIRVGKTLNLNISGEELSNLTLQQYLDLASGQLLFSNDLMIQAHENIAELENNAPLNRGEQAPVDESIRDKYKRMANAAKNGGTKSTNTATQVSPANMSGTKSHAFDNRNTSMQGRELRDAGSTQSDILLRVYDGTRKELIETLYLLMPTLKNAGIKVFFHDKNDSYWNAVVANEGSKSGALNSDAFYNNGVIHINLTNANIQPHVALHEAMHPIIRDLLLSNPDAFRGFVDEILNDPELRALYKDAFVDQYYSAFDIEVQNEEMLTEATARIVFEKILRNLNNAPKSSVERLINYIKNYLGEHFGQLFGYVNTEAKFIDFANSMADAIANGQIVELSEKSKAIIKEAQKGDNRFHATDTVENEQKDGEDRNTTTPKQSINYKSILDNNEKVSEIARSIFEGGSSVARLNRKEEQGRIRGGLRNVEASVLLGADQRANSSEYEQKEGESVRQYHTRIYDRQAGLLKIWAKENGLLKSKDEIKRNSLAEMPRGSEAEVFVNKDGKSVTKIVDVSKYSDTPSEFIDNRISLYNYLFKGTAYQLDGIVEVGDKIHLVLTQPLIQGREMEAKSQLGDKTQKAKLEKYLAEKMKLYPTGYDEYGNNNYILSDVHLNNVFQGKNNMLYFIDVIPSLNTRHREYAPFEIKDNSGIRFHMSREIQQERTDIETKAKGDGTWMKAPNGKPSNLNEAQWVTVRTRKFKENFFGDWEKAIRIEKLLNSKAVEASGNEYRGKYDLNASSAQEYINEKLRGSYDILDTGDRVDITSVGAKEVTAHNRYDEVHLKSISIIPEMLKNAIFIDEQESTKGNSRYDQYRYYAVGLKIGNTDYTAKIVVGVKNGKKFYDHRLTAIEKGKLIDSTSLYHGDFTPKGSESDLLMSQGKDKKLYSILQNSASKVVDENGEPMVVYHGTDNIFTEFKRSENVGTHGESDQLEGIYFADNKEAADWFSDTKNIVPAFLNIRNPYRSKRVKTLKEEQNSDTLKGISGKIEKQGFDGIVLDVGFVARGEQKLILAFNPNQIKSATDNNGEFSKGNNNIRFHFSDAVENIKANMRLDIINNPKEDWEAIAQDMVDEGVFEKQDVDDILAAWRNAKRTKSNPTQTNAALEHMETLQQERKMTEKDNRKVNNAALTEIIEMLNNGGNLEEMLNLYNPYKMKQAVQSVVERGMGHPQDVLATLMELNAQRRPLNVEETIAVGVAISQLEETLSLFPKGSRQYDDTEAMLSQIAIQDKLNGSFAGGALGVRAKLMQMAGLTYHGVMREIESLNKKHKNVEIEEAHKKEIEALVKQHNAIEKALNDANKKLEERLKDAAKKEVAGKSNSGKSTGRAQGSGRTLADIKASILARSKGGALFHLRYSATTNVSTETDDINDMVDWAILNGVAGFENIVNKVIDEWPVPGMTKEKVYRAVLTVTATAKAKAIDEFSQRKSELKDHIRKLNKLESIVHGQADALVKGQNDIIEKQVQMVGRLLNEIEAGIYRINADPTLTDTWLDMIRAIRGDYEMSFLSGGTETEVLNKIMNAVSMMKDAKTARWLKEAMAAADKAIVDINNGKTHELVNISPDTFESMPAKNVTFDVYDSNGNVTGQRTMTMGQAARMIAEKRKEINNVKDKYRKPPPKWMQWYNIIRGTVGSSKAMIDMSATLIQGYGAFAVNMFRNPKALTKALSKSLVAAADEFRKNPGVADEIYRQITENPYYDIAVKYGLNITAPDGMYVNEEMIGTDLFEVAEDALKGKTNMAAKGAKVALNARNRLKNASNAAFATHLNLLSMSMFHQYMEDAAKKNFVPSKEEMEIVIKAINNATGRPTIKETLASKLIWAPRLYLSQIFNLFNMVLDPGRWAKAKIMGQKELSRAYAYRAGNGLALAALLAMSYGLKMLYAKLKCGSTGLVTDWQKSNFLKVECVDQEKGTEISMDASGNMRQWIYQGIVAAHYATGDQIVRMNKEVPYTNIMADWANTHLNPGLRFLIELGTGRDFMNKRTVEDNEGLNRAAIAGKALLPIWPGNIYEYATARGLTPAERIGFTAASAFGPNINYKDLDEEEKEKAEETAKNKAKRDEEKAENIKNAQQEWIREYGSVPSDLLGRFSVSGSPGETTAFDYSTVKPTGRTILLGRKNKKVRYNVYLRNKDTNHNGLLDDLLVIRTTKKKGSLNYGKKYATSSGVNWAKVMGDIKPEKAYK